MTVRLAALVAAVAAAAVAAKGPNMTEWEAKKADAKAAEDAAKAKEKKQAAVNKLLTMLADIRTKVITEGAEEAKTYSQFACFCKDTIAEKQASITSGKDEKVALESSIAELASARDQLDADIAGYLEEIESTQAEVKAAKAAREQELGLYRTNSADMKGALEALEGAIASLKASKPEPSMLQVRDIAKTLRTAAILADTLGLMKGSSKGGLSAFLQQGPDVEMENYKFHSSEIIATLEQLQKDFTDKRNEIDEEEVQAASAHDAAMQEKANKIKTLNLDTEDAKGTKAATVKKIGETSQLLTTTAAELLDDQQYLEKLAEMCSDKKATWDQRAQARQDEISMLTQVLGVIGDAVANKTTAATVRFNQKAVSLRLAKRLAASPGFMEAAEAAAEAAEAPSFLQRRHAPRTDAERAVAAARGREAIIDMLKSQGQKLKSSELMALATQIAGVSSADPFAKVKQLIQELIERLLAQQSNEADQKAWCDKATSAAEQKRGYASEKITELNAQMAEYEALRDKLAEELSVLSSEVEELKANREKAEALRAKEKAESEEAIADATAGLDAVQMAKDIMDKFYKTHAKNEVSLAQQGPADDAPDAGFDNFEAYKGLQGESTGVLGMMEVLESDFQRTITETKKFEAEAEQEHLEFMTETGKSLAEKEVAVEQKDKEKTAAVEELSQAEDDLGTNSEVLQTSIKELLELKAACIDTGMSYSDRKANREEEITALKKAMCILENYAEYGPDGAADQC
jgi:hypothetical protein